LVERISGAAIVHMLSVTPDARIQVKAPDGGHFNFAHGENPAEPGTANDQAELVAALNSAEPARIAGKFLMDILWRARFEDLSELWQRLPAGAQQDSLPNKPERYIYRLRRVDQAGHDSLGAALVPRIYRVPSSRAPGQPVLAKLEFLDVTSQAAAEKIGSSSHGGRQFDQYRITNRGQSVVDTHLLIIVRGLPHETELENASGTTRSGDPYIRVFLPNGVLQPGQDIVQTLIFSREGGKNPSPLSYVLDLLSGQGNP
jgi:hypothetical protein